MMGVHWAGLREWYWAALTVFRSVGKLADNWAYHMAADSGCVTAVHWVVSKDVYSVFLRAALWGCNWAQNWAVSTEVPSVH